jgi:hypothetical protein
MSQSQRTKRPRSTRKILHSQYVNAAWFLTHKQSEQIEADGVEFRREITETNLPRAQRSMPNYSRRKKRCCARRTPRRSRDQIDKVSNYVAPAAALA